MHFFAPLLCLITGLLTEFCQVEVHKHLDILRLSMPEIKTHGHVPVEVGPHLLVGYPLSII